MNSERKIKKEKNLAVTDESVSGSKKVDFGKKKKINSEGKIEEEENMAVTDEESVSGSKEVDFKRKSKKINAEGKVKKEENMAGTDEESVSGGKEGDFGKKKKIKAEGKLKKGKNKIVSEKRSVSKSEEGSFKRKRIIKINLEGMMKKKNIDMAETDAAINEKAPVSSSKDDDMERKEKTKVSNPVKKKRVRKKNRYVREPCECDECGKKFTHTRNLARHKLFHSGEKPFLCHECGAAFTRKDSLNLHMSAHHDDIVKRVKSQQKQPEECVECAECGKVFKRKVWLKVHMRVHTGEKPVSCEICGKAFSDKSYIITHMRTHTGEKPYSCEKCGRTFAQKCQASLHMRTHTGEKPYLCKECGKTFSQSCGLKRHIQSNHREEPKEKPFSCVECGKAFLSKYNLGKHMKKHTGEKPFSCEVCGKAFTAKYSLKGHMTIHTGEKPFSCPKCGKKFGVKGDCTKHMKTCTGQKSLSCTECGKCFDKMSSLSIHMKTHIICQDKSLKGTSQLVNIPHDIVETKRIINYENLAWCKYSSRGQGLNAGDSVEPQACSDNVPLAYKVDSNVRSINAGAQFNGYNAFVAPWENPEPNQLNSEIVCSSHLSNSAERLKIQIGDKSGATDFLPQTHEERPEFQAVSKVGTPMLQQPSIDGRAQMFQVQHEIQKNLNIEIPVFTEHTKIGTQVFDGCLGIGTTKLHGNADVRRQVFQGLETRMPVFSEISNLETSVFQKAGTQEFITGQGTSGQKQISHNVGTQQSSHFGTPVFQDKVNHVSLEGRRQLEPHVPSNPSQGQSPVSPDETVMDDTVTIMADSDSEDVPNESIADKEADGNVPADNIKNDFYYRRLLTRIAPLISGQLEASVLEKSHCRSGTWEERTNSAKLSMASSIDLRMAALDCIMDKRSKTPNASLSLPLFLKANTAKFYHTGERPIANMTKKLDPALDRLVGPSWKENFSSSKVSSSMDEVNHLITANYRSLEILSLMDWTLGIVLGDLKKLKEVIPKEHKQTIVDSIGFIELLGRAEQDLVGEVAHSYSSSILKKREHIVSMLPQLVSKSLRAKLIFDRLSSFALFDEKLLSELDEVVENACT